MVTRRISKAFTNLIQHGLQDEQYRLFISEDDEEKVIQNLKFVEKLYPEQVIMLCNRSHPALHYVGKNCSSIFGFDSTEFQSLSVNDFFSLVHPDDLQGLLQCFEFINNSEPYNPCTHRFVLHYRFKKKNNFDYQHIRDEKLAIETDPKKFIYFSSFRDITAQEKFFHVKLDIYQYTNGRGMKVYSYHPRQPEKNVTRRQNDIIKLLIQGFSNQDIAERLQVSVNTIKNHKKAMFRKVNVKNSFELINLASRTIL